MTIGTKSLLLGAHCFFLHPFALAISWTRLFGFPCDARIWVAFFIHDVGYHRCHDMDRSDGEQHVWLGSKIMWQLFDRADDHTPRGALSRFCDHVWGHQPEGQFWAHFCLFHSRSFAKRFHQPVSRLCAADKLAFAVTPHWLYLPMVTLTGEIHEYLDNAKVSDARVWHRSLRLELLRWVARYRRSEAQGDPTLVPLHRDIDYSKRRADSW